MLASLNAPAIADRKEDPIGRVVVRPRVLAGPNGELADEDLRDARGAEIEELISASLLFSVHCEHALAIAVEWDIRFEGSECPRSFRSRWRGGHGGVRSKLIASNSLTLLAGSWQWRGFWWSKTTLRSGQS